MRRAILILGAAVWPTGPSPTLRRRTRAGADLYLAGGHDLILVCGGLGRFPPSEAQAMRALLLEAGLPESAIRCEDRSTNTAGNIALALPILRAEGIGEVTLVSDAYHLPRARLIARRHGLIVHTHAPPAGKARPWPQVRGLVREGFAILAVLLRLR